MKAIDIPELVQLPWADGAGPTYINSIPTASQIGITTGLASLTDGFPPVTFLDEGAGGQPPFGADFNGALNLISGNTRWSNAGAFYPYDSAFSAYVGGYPQGAILVRADNTGFWLSTIDDNTNDPDSVATGWVPINNQGVTTVSGLTNTNVTLTPLQYAKNQVVLSGTLTGNVQIIFPAFAGQEWEVINLTTGNFTATCKTAAGTGYIIPQNGALVKIGSDGTNIVAVATGVLAGSALVGVTGLPAVRGNARNLKASATGGNAVVSITADEIVLESAANGYVVARSVSESATLTSSGANGLDTGSPAYSTWYYFYLIYNPSTLSLDALISASSTSPTLPSGYTYFARVGSFRTQSATSYYPLAFIQVGKKVRYKVGGANVPALPLMDSGIKGTYSNTTPTYASVAVAAFVPPTAVSIGVLLNGTYNSTSAANILVAPNNSYGGPASTNPPPASVDNSAGFTHIGVEMILESSNIYWTSASSAAAAIHCLGYEDNF